MGAVSMTRILGIFPALVRLLFAKDCYAQERPAHNFNKIYFSTIAIDGGGREEEAFGKLIRDLTAICNKPDNPLSAIACTYVKRAKRINKMIQQH